MKGNMYLAWSAAEEILEKAEYGGVVTSLLKFALESQRVDAVLATKARDGNRYDGIPVLITDPQEVIGTAGALHAAPVNIARCLKEYLDGAANLRIAVVCKPCDAKAIIELTKRAQINIDNLLLIGLNCTGTLSPATARKMFEQELGIAPDDVVREDIEDSKLTVWLKDGTELETNLAQLEEKGYGRRENCRRCETSIPTMADIACGKWGVEDGKKATFVETFSEKGSTVMDRAIKAGYILVEQPDDAAVERRGAKAEAAAKLARSWQERDFAPFKEMSLEQRFHYWLGQFSQCIKCFGCRDACPICYCKACWLEAERGYVQGGEIPPNAMWPMVRIVHVMDSCVNCGQCQDVCSMNLPLTRLIFMLNRQIAEIFKYEPGMDPSTRPPCAFVTEEETSLDTVSISF
ncbi:MAG: Coenzyme F420 hydrogenase/dehydrogenase, beta subunit C-terminal domain [Anaerolineales bacterium]|nr:Coenzyme F420 hydrogenase/dehydrogenase, beta subunit C-terminal domain [Anaerolineales bacterium]